MRQANKGPAAAHANRTALIEAARELFASDGYDVPLSRIAAHAGVGRASLYRHFPSRTALAWAVFDDNVAVLNTIAEDVNEHTFARLWNQLVRFVLDSRSLISFIVDISDHEAARDLDIESIIDRPLRLAQEHGSFTGLSTKDISVTLRMLWGVLALSRPEDRLDDASHALQLIHPDLAAGIR